MIRLVTFDFWDTLVVDSPENLRAQQALRVTAIRRALHDARAPVTEAQAEEIHERSGLVLAERFWSQNRDPSPAQQLRIVLETREPGIAAQLSPAAFAAALDAYISPVLSHPPELSPGAHRAVKELAARGVQLGIVSNTGRTPGVILRRVLERHGVLRYFGPIAYSDEIGVRKPEAEIFRAALAGAGVEPAESLHIGDNPDADVVGARASGMRAAHYTAGVRMASVEADLIVLDLETLADQVFRVARTRAAG